MAQDFRETTAWLHGFLFSLRFLRALAEDVEDEDDNLPANKKKLNLLLLGTTGSGKSATGNSTLNRKAFDSRSSGCSVTLEVESSQAEYNNYIINIIDTPGLDDTRYMDCEVEGVQMIIDNIEKAINMASGRVHAFLYVVRFDSRFTAQDKKGLETLKQIFGRDFFENNGIIVFTHGDCFESSMEEDNSPKKSFQDWCREQRGTLAALMYECNYRCVLFNNKKSDTRAKQEQIKQLVETIESFQFPYTAEDFIKCSDLRNTLVVRLKLPKLKEKFQSEINSLELDIELYSKSMSEGVYTRLTKKWEELKTEINSEDLRTGLLNDMKAQLPVIRLKMVRYKREYDRGWCFIL